MSVPLDRLYNFLHDVCNRDDIIIYRFFPHGSRKILDLSRLVKYGKPSEKLKKFIIFYDQEPLNFDLYTEPAMFNKLLDSSPNYTDLKEILNEELHQKLLALVEQTVYRSNLKLAIGTHMYDIPVILVHSEQRSQNLKKYQDHEFITAYWWSHALISRDWFRYAELDPKLASKQVTKDFLIYNRAWSGTREYRLKFAELIVENNLSSYCRMGFNPKDQGHYKDHLFANKKFQIKNTTLENYFMLNNFDSSSSADYVAEDYQNTGIEIVLETLFDDDRLQLTEKVLRPIACGQPFMLAATHGSLKYLHEYGFETFSTLINEDYDNIEDPVLRLEAVVEEMKRIASLPRLEKSRLYSELRKISHRNKQLFFSKEWQELILNEYKTNLNHAIEQLDTCLKNKFKNFSLL